MAKKFGDSSTYLKVNLSEVLPRALHEVCQARPPDPIEFLAKCLYKATDCEIYYQEKAIFAKEMQMMSIQMKREDNERQNAILRYKKHVYDLKRILLSMQRGSFAGGQINEFRKKPYRTGSLEGWPSDTSIDSTISSSPVRHVRRTSGSSAERRSVVTVQRDSSSITHDSDSDLDRSISLHTSRSETISSQGSPYHGISSHKASPKRTRFGEPLGFILSREESKRRQPIKISFKKTESRLFGSATHLRDYEAHIRESWRAVGEQQEAKRLADEMSKLRAKSFLGTHSRLGERDRKDSKQTKTRWPSRIESTPEDGSPIDYELIDARKGHQKQLRKPGQRGKETSTKAKTKHQMRSKYQLQDKPKTRKMAEYLEEIESQESLEDRDSLSPTSTMDEYDKEQMSLETKDSQLEEGEDFDETETGTRKPKPRDYRSRIRRAKSPDQTAQTELSKRTKKKLMKRDLQLPYDQEDTDDTVRRVHPKTRSGHSILSEKESVKRELFTKKSVDSDKLVSDYKGRESLEDKELTDMYIKKTIDSKEDNIYEDGRRKQEIEDESKVSKKQKGEKRDRVKRTKDQKLDYDESVSSYDELEDEKIDKSEDDIPMRRKIHKDSRLKQEIEDESKVSKKQKRERRDRVKPTIDETLDYDETSYYENEPEDEQIDRSEDDIPMRRKTKKQPKRSITEEESEEYNQKDEFSTKRITSKRPPKVRGLETEDEEGAQKKVKLKTQKVRKTTKTGESVEEEDEADEIKRIASKSRKGSMEQEWDEEDDVKEVKMKKRRSKLRKSIRKRETDWEEDDIEEVRSRASTVRSPSTKSEAGREASENEEVRSRASTVRSSSTKSEAEREGEKVLMRKRLSTKVKKAGKKREPEGEDDETEEVKKKYTPIRKDDMEDEERDSDAVSQASLKSKGTSQTDVKRKGKKVPKSAHDKERDVHDNFLRLALKKLKSGKSSETTISKPSAASSITESFKGKRRSTLKLLTKHDKRTARDKLSRSQLVKSPIPLKESKDEQLEPEQVLKQSLFESYLQRKKPKTSKATVGIESSKKVKLSDEKKKTFIEDAEENEETRRSSKTSTALSTTSSGGTLTSVKIKKATTHVKRQKMKKPERIQDIDDYEKSKDSSDVPESTSKQQISEEFSELLDLSVALSAGDAESYSTITPVDCEWILNPQRILVCLHPVLGELRAHPVSDMATKNFSGWPERLGYTWQSFYDPEVYTMLDPYADDPQYSRRKGKLQMDISKPPDKTTSRMSDLELSDLAWRAVTTAKREDSKQKLQHNVTKLKQ